MRFDSPRCYHALDAACVLPRLCTQKHTHTHRDSKGNACIYSGVHARKAQKGHNGPRSQIGVYNEVNRGMEQGRLGQSGGVVVSRHRSDKERRREAKRGAMERRVGFPLIQDASAPLCCPGALPRPLILAKRQPFCT